MSYRCEKCALFAAEYLVLDFGKRDFHQYCDIHYQGWLHDTPSEVLEKLLEGGMLTRKQERDIRGILAEFEVFGEGMPQEMRRRFQDSMRRNDELMRRLSKM